MKRLLVLIFALATVRRDNLLPLTVFELEGCFKGSLAALGVASISIYMCFFLNGLELGEEKLFARLSMWAVAILTLLFWLNTDIIGAFGHELSSRLSQPFFALVRNLVFFRSLERIEAFVVSLWIFSDFILISLCLHSAQHAFRLVLGCQAEYRGERLFQLSGGRWIIWLCGTGTIIFGSLIADQPESLERWSRQIIPGINLFVAVLLLPGIYIIGRVRKRI